MKPAKLKPLLLRKNPLTQHPLQNLPSDTPSLKRKRENTASNRQQEDAINQRAADRETNITIQT